MGNYLNIWSPGSALALASIQVYKYTSIQVYKHVYEHVYEHTHVYKHM